jgi:hypothetical protein
MLLDIWTVLGGIGLAAVAFIVVILVCVVILRLLAAILPSYEDRDARALKTRSDASDEAAETRVSGTDEDGPALDGDNAAPTDAEARASAPGDSGPA